MCLQKMGRLGADGIMAELKARGSNSSKVRMLTHCNTGSLATAAYGDSTGRRGARCMRAATSLMLTAQRPGLTTKVLSLFPFRAHSSPLLLHALIGILCYCNRRRYFAHPARGL